MRKIRRKASLLAANLGINLLSRSGIYSGFFSDWRWAIFDRAERAGIHILPVHYYTPIPNSNEAIYNDQTPLFAAASNNILDAAMIRISEMVECYQEKFSEISDRKPFNKDETISEFRFGIAPYSTLEAELLYGIIRSTKPPRIIEIGSGHTTFLIAEAIRAEKGYSPIFECIEPYRPDYLMKLPSEVTVFNDNPLQSVDIERFINLNKGDIVFIDSSHVAKYGSDVVYEICNILPRLPRGVVVHFHDIFLPYEYPTDWLKQSKFFWNEQYLLSALIQDNPRYRVLYPLHQLYRERQLEVSALFPLLKNPNHRPGAYWLEIMNEPSL